MVHEVVQVFCNDEGPIPKDPEFAGGSRWYGRAIQPYFGVDRELSWLVMVVLTPCPHDSLFELAPAYFKSISCPVGHFGCVFVVGVRFLIGRFHQNVGWEIRVSVEHQEIRAEPPASADL